MTLKEFKEAVELLGAESWEEFLGDHDQFYAGATGAYRNGLFILKELT